MRGIDKSRISSKRQEKGGAGTPPFSKNLSELI